MILAHFLKGRQKEAIMSSQKRGTEGQVRKAVQKALRQYLERTENEPTLVVDRR